MEIEYGKIKKAEYGFGGYQDIEFGLTLEFGGSGWGVSGFIKGENEIKKTLSDAKKRNVSELAGTPVQCSFDKGLLKDWRIFTEVL